MSTPPLVHVIYASAATIEFDDAALTALLKQARENNARLGVTGMLLYTGGDFIQVLEGAQDVVDKLYEYIGRDKRHNRITKIIRESITERAFGEWTMGFAQPTREELADLDGRNDFFAAASCFRALDDGRAKHLLAAFADGRWRTSAARRGNGLIPADRRYAAGHV